MVVVVSVVLVVVVMAVDGGCGEWATMARAFRLAVHGGMQALVPVPAQGNRVPAFRMTLVGRDKLPQQKQLVFYYLALF